MALVNLSDIYPEVRPEVPDCMDVVMLKAIRKAAIEFCEGTHVWQADIDPVTLQADVAEYALAQPAGQIIIMPSKVISSQGRIDPITEVDLDAQRATWRTDAGSQPSRWLMLNPRLMRIYPIPTVSGGELAIRAAVKPSPTGTSIEDYVYDDHYAAIAAGAKAILCAMPGKTWTNPKMVPYYRSIFDDAVREEKGRRVAGYSSAPLRVRPVRFGG